MTSKTAIAEQSPDVIQTAATAAPNIFLLMIRFLNGRNIACIRSKDIAARFATVTIKMERYPTRKAMTDGKIKKLIVQNLHLFPKKQDLASDHTASNKHVSNYLVYHQVHAALAKTAHFQVDNDYKSIHYGNRLHAKQC